MATMGSGWDLRSGGSQGLPAGWHIAFPGRARAGVGTGWILLVYDLKLRGFGWSKSWHFPWHSPDDLTSIFSIASDKLRVCYGKWSIDRLDRWFAFEKWWFSVALKHQRVSQLPWRLLGDLKKQFFAYRNRCVFWRFHHQSMNWQGFLWNHQNHGPSLSQKITQNMASAHSWIPLRKPSFSTKWGPLDS